MAKNRLFIALLTVSLGTMVSMSAYSMEATEQIEVDNLNQSMVATKQIEVEDLDQHKEATKETETEDPDQRKEEYLKSEQYGPLLGDLEIYIDDDELTEIFQKAQQDPEKFLGSNFALNDRFSYLLTHQAYDSKTSQAIDNGSKDLFVSLLNKGILTQDLILKTTKKQPSQYGPANSYEDSLLRTILLANRADFLTILIEQEIVTEADIVAAFKEIKYLQGTNSLGQVIQLINTQFGLSLTLPTALLS